MKLASYTHSFAVLALSLFTIQSASALSVDSKAVANLQPRLDGDASVSDAGSSSTASRRRKKCKFTKSVSDAAISTGGVVPVVTGSPAPANNASTLANQLSYARSYKTKCSKKTGTVYQPSASSSPDSGSGSDASSSPSSGGNPESVSPGTGFSNLGSSPAGNSPAAGSAGVCGPQQTVTVTSQTTVTVTQIAQAAASANANGASSGTAPADSGVNDSTGPSGSSNGASSNGSQGAQAAASVNANSASSGNAPADSGVAESAGSSGSSNQASASGSQDVQAAASSSAPMGNAGSASTSTAVNAPSSSGFSGSGSSGSSPSGSGNAGSGNSSSANNTTSGNPDSGNSGSGNSGSGNTGSGNSGSGNSGSGNSGSGNSGSGNSGSGNSGSGNSGSGNSGSGNSGSGNSGSGNSGSGNSGSGNSGSGNSGSGNSGSGNSGSGNSGSGDSGSGDSGSGDSGSGDSASGTSASGVSEGSSSGNGPYYRNATTSGAASPSGTGSSVASMQVSNSTNGFNSTNSTSDTNLNGQFWAGATIGTVMRMEAIPQRVFYDYDGKTVKDPIKTLADAGVNVIRVEAMRGQCLGPTNFVNNGSTLGEELTFTLDWGCIDIQVKTAQRSVAQGMRVVLTINQGFDIPLGMESYSYEQMVDEVQKETQRQLQPFLDAKIVPDVILFENEGSDGFLFNDTATGHTRGSNDGKAPIAQVDKEKCGIIPTGNLDSFPQYAGYLKAEVMACNDAIAAAGLSTAVVRYGLHSHGQYVQWKESVVHGPNAADQTNLTDTSGKSCSNAVIPQNLLSQNVSELLTIMGFSAYPDPMTPTDINSESSERDTFNRTMTTLTELMGYAEAYGKYESGPFAGQYKLQSLGVEYGTSYTYDQVPQEQQETTMMWSLVKQFPNVLGMMWYEPWYCHADWEGGLAALCHNVGTGDVSGQAPTDTLKTWGSAAQSPWKK